MACESDKSRNAVVQAGVHPGLRSYLILVALLFPLGISPQRDSLVGQGRWCGSFKLMSSQLSSTKGIVFPVEESREDWKAQRGYVAIGSPS